jgi:SAM-dependent methyltransferase
MRGTVKRALNSIGLLGSTRKVRDGVWYRWRALQCRWSGVAQGMPVPPRELTYLVSGHCDVLLSLRNGGVAAQSIRDALNRNGLDLDKFEAVLDFGCGSGRVLRNFGSLSGRLYGADYNAILLEFCRTKLRLAEVRRNDLAPPTEWPDSKFDLVYLLSVFTHLTEPVQHLWLNEFKRIIRPGGYLLFSVHGEKFLPSLSKENQTAFNRGELVMVQRELEGRNECGAYHPESYVRSNLTQGWELVDFIPEGARGNGGQDYYLFRKPNATRADELP